ncbi:MAG: aminotransferase class I/II-fold pyridoxal phosphate-dependent enzyme [Dysosmobacter sp.]
MSCWCQSPSTPTTIRFTFIERRRDPSPPPPLTTAIAFADRKLIESQINERTRAILVTNPGNPTGLVLTRGDAGHRGRGQGHDLFLVADEVYREFIYDDEPMGTFCELEDIKDHVIVVDSISKRFSACGARIGSIISRNREFMAEAMKSLPGAACALLPSIRRAPPPCTSMCSLPTSRRFGTSTRSGGTLW